MLMKSSTATANNILFSATLLYHCQFILLHAWFLA